jgi:hypothetical protein
MLSRKRCPTCASAMRPCGSFDKAVLQPNETGKLQVTIDTRRFHGPKAASCYLTIERRGIAEEIMLAITANAIVDGE